MPQCSGTEWLIVCAIWRKTAGWGKENDMISLTQFHEMTGIAGRSNISNAIKSLTKKGIIGRKRDGRQGYAYFVITSHESLLVTNRYQSRIVTRTSHESLPELVTNRDTQKKKEKRNTTTTAREDFGDVISVYENEIAMVSPIVSERIGDWVSDVGAQWVIDAINESALNNKRSWKYAEAILKRWKIEGRYTSRKPGAIPQPQMVPDENGFY